MKVIIDGRWELGLPTPPRVGDLIAGAERVGRVTEVVWLMPDELDDEVRVHVQLDGGP